MGAACAKQEEKKTIEKHARDRPPDSRALVAVYPPVSQSQLSHQWSILILNLKDVSRKGLEKGFLGGQELEPFATYPLTKMRRFPDVPPFSMNTSSVDLTFESIFDVARCISHRHACSPVTYLHSRAFSRVLSDSCL